MTNYQMIPQIINSTMCVTTAVMLLTIKSYSQFGSNRFDRIKQMLAFCGLFEAVKVFCEFYCDYFNIDLNFVHIFIIPDIYFLQVCMISMGLLGLVHSPMFTDKKLLIAASPFGVFAVVHLLAYLIYSGCDISVSTYMNFVCSEFSYVLCWIVWILTCVEMIVYFYLLLTETHKYRHHLVNLLSGSEVVNGRKLSYLVYGFLGYFILLFVANYIGNRTFHIAFMLFIMAIYLAGVIVMFNIQDMYSRVMIVEDYMQGNKKEEASQLTQDHTEMDKINTLVSKWESREDKPFLKGGLTLVDVSLDMCVEPQQLSDYLNNVCKMNFNKWIDVHRIDEAIQLIAANADANLNAIATQVGFDNLKNMTKSFRQIIGKDPNEFKQNGPVA